MKRTVVALGATLASIGAIDAQGPVFSFPYTIHDFDNGVRLVTVPTGDSGVVSVHCVVQVGSRDEVEEGRSGFAHFFEHMMFRGTETLTSEEQAALFKQAGADRNAYTTDDYTIYHTTVPAEELETVLRLEGDRFRFLSYAENAFRTEAMAVYGEYNKNSSNPINMLFERIRATAFDRHTYQHTTMGFLKDIRAMPRMYDYSLSFFDRFYRPEYVTILVVGDTDPERTKQLVAEHWLPWERGGHVAEVPAEPEQDGPRAVHVKWPSPTNPWVVIAHKGPAFSTTAPDMAALDLISQVAFGESSPLYQRLYVDEGKVDQFFPYFPDARDPGLVYVFARVRDPADWAYVRDAILAKCEALGREAVDAERLERVKQHQRYGFAASLESPASIADALAGYVARTRDPGSVNAVYELYASLAPEDLRRAAAGYLVPHRRTIATLSHAPLPEAPPPAAATIDGGEYPGILMPTASPLVSMRLCFETGASDDPAGKEGLTWITLQLLTKGATTERSYAEILDALYPMAASVSTQVGEEISVVHGTVHRDNVQAYADLVVEMLTGSAFRAEDLERVKQDAIAAIDVGLRRADDEELGKQVLLGEIFAGHPYEHLDMGTLESVQGITVDDVRGWAAKLISQPTIGLAGGYAPDFARLLAARLRPASTEAEVPGSRVATGWPGQPPSTAAEAAVFPRRRIDDIDWSRFAASALPEDADAPADERLTMPDGRTYRLLNGAKGITNLGWPKDVPYAPIVERVRHDDRVWYRHADGSYSTMFVDEEGRSWAHVANPTDAGDSERVPPAPTIEHNRLTIVEKDTRATGIHIGFPIEVTRDHPDWAALWLARSFFGEHRSENSYLYQRLREIRGLNYGDYAYIEYFPEGGGAMQPPPNHPRSRPTFSIWIRPVPHENGPFTLKATWYELDKLVREGLTEAQFTATRDFLDKYCALLTQSDDRRLGYALDQAWYGLEPWVPFVRAELAKLTVDDVNAAIRRHLRSDPLQIVVVTDDAARFRDAILGDEPTPITYGTPPDQEILDEDAVIEALRLDLTPERVEILPIDAVFVR